MDKQDARLIFLSYLVKDGFTPYTSGNRIYAINSFCIRLDIQKGVLTKDGLSVEIVVKEKDDCEKFFELGKYSFSSTKKLMPYKYDKFMLELESNFGFAHGNLTKASEYKKIDSILSKMACERLGLDTLDTRYCDSYDFHEVSVNGLSDVLLSAYLTGVKYVGSKKQGRVQEALENIAKKCMRVETLKSRHSDSLDFPEVAVWCIKDALFEAFEYGLNM